MKDMKHRNSPAIAIVLAAALAFPGSMVAAQEKAPTAASKQEVQMRAFANALAVQAATYGAPIVAMYNLRSTVAVGPKAKAPPGTFWRVDATTDSSYRYTNLGGIPASNYTGLLEVKPRGTGCAVTWSASYLSSGQTVRTRAELRTVWANLEPGGNQHA